MKWLAYLMLGCISAFGSSLSRETLAQDLEKDTSLRFVPVDADVYLASWRHSEQWARFIQSPISKAFMELPVVQKNWDRFQSDWKDRKPELVQARKVWDNPNFKEALKFALDLASNETFFFADKNLSVWLKSVNDFSTSIQQAASATDEAAQDRFLEMIDGWIDRLDKMKLPTIVLGARFTDDELAITKVDQLEAAIQLPLMTVPELSQIASAVKRIEDNRGSRVVIELSGRMIPWDSIPTTEMFDEESLDHLREVLFDRSICITLGTLDKYFVVAITEKSKDLLNLGQEKGLMTHPDFAPVSAVADKPLTSVLYTSDVLSAVNWENQFKNFFSEIFAQFSDQFRLTLDAESELHDFLDDVEGDVEWIDTQIAKFVPQFKGQTAYSFLTNDGWEMAQHIRTKDVLLDGSKPLEGLNHVGGSPLMMVVTRLGDHPEYFKLMRSIVQRIKGRFDEAAKLDWSDIGGNTEQVRKIHQQIDMAWPLAQRLAEAWETKFLPGFDGEHGVVLTAGNLSAKQWAKNMPSSDVPLALPEVAWIAKTRNQELLKEGGKEFFSVCDSILDLIRRVEPNSIPSDYTIPRPTKMSDASGEKFGYPIPDNFPVPKGMMPHALFGDRYMIISYSEQQSQTLTKESPLSIGRGIFLTDRPLASSSYINAGGIIKTLLPWLTYAVQQAEPDLGRELIPDTEESLAGYSVTPKDLLSAVQLLEKLGEFSSTTSVDAEGRAVVRSVYAAQSLP